MTCEGCLWLHSDSGQSYCVKRDGKKLEKDELKFPKNPNWGCDEKIILITNATGEKIPVTGVQIFIPFPGGYE